MSKLSKGRPLIAKTPGVIRKMHYQAPRVAVVHQTVEPPVINGVRKPKKPGGYRDSASDIAYVLKKAGVHVVTPASNPRPNNDTDWCFGDEEEDIVSAVDQGATHIWANTILFASHPLQTSAKLTSSAAHLKIVGQPPLLVEQYDDKNFVNELLRRNGTFMLPKSWLVSSLKEIPQMHLEYPLVAKPIRGRGSHGVKLCNDENQLQSHLHALLAESSPAMLEQYLPGQEGTVTVMPPSQSDTQYTSLPIVVRFNHDEGIAPYNGVVAVVANSRVPPEEERQRNPAYAEIERACERVAETLGVTAPIRIDVRQISEEPHSPFAIFDVNMKPNMTGPGRPGREDQTSLTALAAAEVGWDYPKLLQEILASAQTLAEMRSRKINNKH